MKMLLRYLLACTVLSSSAAWASYLPSESQAVLGFDVANVAPEEGLLKSFAIEFAKGWGVEDVLEAAEAAGADVWRVSQSQVDVYFPTEEIYSLSRFNGSDLAQRTSRIPGSALVPRVARAPSSSWNLTSLSNTTFHADYHPLHEIEEFVEALAALHPEVVQLVNIGHSAEGREMFAMRLSKNTGKKAKAKAGFVITGAQHAREWVATSTVLYLIHALVASASEPYAMSTLLDYYDFHIIPVPNPDGYVYTWEHDRLWYKNRQILGPSEKNWGYKWKAKARFPEFELENKPSLPTDPCTPWYPGHRPFESPETNNIANYVTTLPALKTYIDLRAYGQMLSTPWAYSCKKTTKDAEDQIEAAHGAARAIKQAHGKTFTAGTLCSMTYKAPGNVVDWMYAKAGIKFAYAVHLRDTGTYGFSLPSEWIRPVGEETVNMIAFLAEFIRMGKYCESPPLRRFTFGSREALRRFLTESGAFTKTGEKPKKTDIRWEDEPGQEEGEDDEAEEEEGGGG
ncbi:uncharacterized protein FIBRA_05597 [Fibroporia radiculosa]|uniref:Inactive metallocarboxypeptidase ECM14 n=1 Tax=Fibroporia radiculosa TaxID=599839 RepID=J4H3L7_9APHY|nr:uncharacterized protein FIBRA_05597 [Fibroporia radiculosa]CCM03464.1 predicted protein [Fibroporia radiculosa]